ncbi:MAG TPA: precorrin-6y C5,15-methyltransferase (decarboxylating) subunit CbiE [Candidatus Hypogeohydataceae bacterium YC41]
MARRIGNKVVIVGCGPGSLGYITLKALRRIQEADVLVGSRRLLSLFPEVQAEKLALGGKNYRPLLNKIASLSMRKRVVVLVSGDPGFFSYASLLINKLGKETCEIVPGISCIQLAFAAIGRSWNDACFVSLHGRKTALPRLVEALKTRDTVAVLNDNAVSPGLLCEFLRKEGIKGKKIYLCENLSLEKERVRELDFSSLEEIEAEGMNVMIFLSE